MAMSEEERRRFEALEHELAVSDPELGRALQMGAPGMRGRQAGRMVCGIFALVSAFALVIVGIATELIIVGAAGFVLMIGGALWFLRGAGLQGRSGHTS